MTDPDTERQYIERENGRSIPHHCPECGAAFPWAGKARNGKDEQSLAGQPANLTVFGSGNVIQVQSPNSNQTALISAAKVEESLNKLLELVRQCPSSELEREKARAALESLRPLDQKPKSTEVLAKANEKLELVKNTIGTAVELGKIAAPYIALLGEHFAR